MSPTKKILIGLGVTLVVLIGAAVLLGGDDEGAEVETAEARVRPITQSVTASGVIAAETEVSISPEISGEVVFVGVNEGDRVERGQLLLRIRADVYATQRQQAIAGVRAAQTDVDAARADAAQVAAEREQLTADIAQAEAERERASRAMERQQALLDQGLGSEVELEQAQAAARQAEATFQAAQARLNTLDTRIASANARVRGAQARVGSAQASAQQSAQQLALTSIYAPMSGTVTYLNVEEGETVVGTATMAGTELMRIAELDQMTIEIEVSETDVARLALGDSAMVEVDAFPDDALTGVVSEIATSARTGLNASGQQSTNFPVTVAILAEGESATAAAVQLASADGETDRAPRTPAVQVRPGMNGTVDVFTRTIENAVVVPIQAVTVRDMNEIRRDSLRTAAAEGDESADPDAVPEEEDLQRVVFVVVDGEVEMRRVETGIADDTHIEIASGLAGGEVVVTGPFNLLRTTLDPGDAVRTDDDEE
ncbi:MAG: efflux RND transporter periplasmic adaptor subunit [Bacteroidota bacterium]